MSKKSEELDNQIREKSKLREDFNLENDRLKREIENLLYRYSILENEK